MYVDDINTNVHLHTYFIVTNVFQIQKELEKHLTTEYVLWTYGLRKGEKTGRPGRLLENTLSKSNSKSKIWPPLLCFFRK